jgi:hypothetical protein
MTKIRLITICTFVLLLLLSQTAHACFCSVVNTKRAFLSADIVFVGKVSEIKAAKQASVLYSMPSVLDILKSRGNGKWGKHINEVQVVTLEVIESLKGITKKTFVLFTPNYNGGGSCGIQFKMGESFVVFAGKSQPLLSKQEAEQSKEKQTLERRLSAEADEFNKQLPLYQTNICMRTDRLRFMNEEIKEIHNFLKNGEWQQEK